MKIKSSVIKMTIRPYMNIYTPPLLPDVIEYSSFYCFAPSATVSLKSELIRHAPISGLWYMLFKLSQRFLHQKYTRLHLSLYSGHYLNVSLQIGPPSTHNHCFPILIFSVIHITIHIRRFRFLRLVFIKKEWKMKFQYTICRMFQRCSTPYRKEKINEWE